MCVCVCVCERERKREKENLRHFFLFSFVSTILEVRMASFILRYPSPNPHL